MALLKFINHESFLIHGIALKGQVPYATYRFIRCRLLILFHPIAFEHLAYSVRVVQIIIARSSSHSTLVWTLKGMDPTPHVVMPIS